MKTKIKNARLILPSGIETGKSIYFENGKITAITAENLNAERVIDAEGCYASAGFIDIHVHGGDGFEFVDATKEALTRAANIHAKHGTTTLFPTISAFDIKTTESALKAIRDHKDGQDILPNIGGVHLEGPYFSKAQCGAQDTSYIRNPDKIEYEKLLNEYGDIIKRWTYAPELSGADEFLSFLNSREIVAAAGHTDAEYSDMLYAYEHGCRLITHFYSCMSTVKRFGGFRHLGVIESGYLFDEIYLEAIADGCHLPPELLKLIYKLKGADYTCLITDAIRFGGMANCENAVGGTENIPYIIEDGVAKLADRSAFAGSIATMDTLIRTCTKKAGIPLTDAVKMATEVPAKIMKLSNKGMLSVGFDADMVIFDDDINVKQVIVKNT